jgi:hypothetical protein
MVKSFGLLSLLLLPEVLNAQRFPDRWVTINPLMDTRVAVGADEWSWMHSSAGWGEFGAYRMVRDAEHAWLQRLGMFVELFRVGHSSSLAFVGEIEFIANPDNDIRFNPRAVFWQEGFLFTQQSGNLTWQLGYYHRCKHDVDNLILNRERSLIYGSVLGKLLIPLSAEASSTRALLALRTDIYTIRQDDRFPRALSDRQPHLKRMIGTVGAALHVRESLRSPFGLYAAAWSALSGFGEKETTFFSFDRPRSATFQGGIAAGVAVEGAAHVRIGISYEYLSDTGLNPQPEHAHLANISVTIINPFVMW